MAQKIDKIYDRIFKRMMTLSSKSIIALINGLFGTSYPLDSTLTYNLTENLDSKLNRTIADTIITVNHIHSYHMEAQMYEDDNIIFRMFDYGYQHALKTPDHIIPSDTSEKSSNTIADNSYDRITFPEPVIIYLADDKPLPDTYILEIDFGHQGSFLYSVPVCNFITMPPEEIEKRNMVVLLPFYILKLRRTMQKDRSPEVLEQLKTLIFDDIITIINRQFNAEIITVSDANMLREFLLKLYNHLYADYNECKEGGVNEMVEDEIIFQTDVIIAETTEKVTKEVTESVTKAVTQKLNDKYSKELAEKDRIIKAYQLLAKHTPVDQIAKETGLSPEEIHKL